MGNAHSRNQKHPPRLHKPLNRTSNQIRLFKFTKNDAFDVAATLEIFNLNDNPRFCAISYEWGSQLTTRKILVNHHELDISANLYSFLEVCQNWNVGDYFWADQVCIAQHDTEERNHQVGQMSSIFSRAETVIAWLGRHPGLEYLIGCPSQVHELYHRQRADFQKLSFWSRLWVQQELVLAERLYFALGPYLFDLDDLKVARLDSGLSEQALLNILFHENAHDTQRRFGLLEATEYFSHKACSDPRDKVYGLQGMVLPSERVPIDYSLSVAEVFQRTVEKALDVRGIHPQSNSEIRSWISLAMLGHYLGLKHWHVKNIYEQACKKRFDSLISASLPHEQYISTRSADRSSYASA